MFLSIIIILSRRYLPLFDRHDTRDNNDAASWPPVVARSSGIDVVAVRQAGGVVAARRGRTLALKVSDGGGCKPPF